MLDYLQTYMENADLQAALVVVGLVILYDVAKLVIKKLRKLVTKTSTKTDDEWLDAIEKLIEDKLNPKKKATSKKTS